MSRKQLKLEQALEILPQVAELAPLRDALVDSSRPDADKAWAGSQTYLALDQRLVDPAELQGRVPELAERVRERTERLLGHAAAALAAAERRDWVRAARELVAAGEVEEAVRQFEAAEQFYQRARELGRKPRDRSVEGLALRRLGRVARALGDRERAIALYRQGLEIAEAQRDLAGMVVACQGVGNVYGDQGQWERAREWYQRGLSLLQHSPPRPELWELYANLATVERHAGNLQRARHWLDQAESVIEALDAASGMFFLENNRGLLFTAEGDPIRAQQAFQKALTHTTDPYLQTVGLVNLSESLLQQKRGKEAQQVAREAERVAIGSRIVAKLPAVYRMLGTIAGATGDPEAFLFFEEALAVCRRYGLPPVEHALTQHEYGLLDARHGDQDAARSRLQAAVEELEEIGAPMEAARVRSDLASLDQHLP